MKHNQFYREARLACHLYRQIENICIGIDVFKRVAHVEKSVSMQQHFKQFVGKQRGPEGKNLGISEAEPLRFDCVNQFSLGELCRT